MQIQVHLGLHLDLDPTGKKQGCGSGSALILPPGSGSRKKNFSNKNRKKAKKLLITTGTVLLNFLSKFAQSSIVSYFRVIFYVFYDYRKLFMRLFFTKFVKLDPDPHGSGFILPPGSVSAFRKTAGSGSAKMNADPQPWLTIY